MKSALLAEVLRKMHGAAYPARFRLARMTVKALEKRGHFVREVWTAQCSKEYVVFPTGATVDEVTAMMPVFLLKEAATRLPAVDFGYSAMSDTSCQHDWKQMDGYSSPFTLIRYRCAGCGIWAFKQIGGYAKPRIVPYMRMVQHLTEPLSEWEDAANREQNEWRRVGARSPDRDTTLDDSADYKRPRRG